LLKWQWILAVLIMSAVVGEIMVSAGTCTRYIQSSGVIWSWEHIFHDERRNTTLKITTDAGYFRFIAPNKMFSVKQDPNMTVRNRSISINFEDSEIMLHTTAIITQRWSLCMAIATDVEIGVRYHLTDLNRNAVYVTSVRIIPSHGVIKVISAVNASVSIPSYGSIDYGSADFHRTQQGIRDLRDEASGLREESLNISEPKGLTKSKPR